MERISFREAPGKVYETMRATENYVRSSVEPRLLELIKVRASQINGCAYCIDMHIKDALKAGETFQRLYSLDAWRETDYYTDKERAALKLTETLTLIAENHMSDELYRELQDHFSKEEIANLTLAICQINSWNRLAIAFGTKPGSYQPD